MDFGLGGIWYRRSISANRVWKWQGTLCGLLKKTADGFTKPSWDTGRAGKRDEKRRQAEILIKWGGIDRRAP
jgi:hypothetical protein